MTEKFAFTSDAYLQARFRNVGANFHYVLSSIARRFFYNAEVSILGKLSREGKGVPDIDVAFRFGTKLTMLGATNGLG